MKEFFGFYLILGLLKVFEYKFQYSNYIPYIRKAHIHQKNRLIARL